MVLEDHGGLPDAGPDAGGLPVLGADRRLVGVGPPVVHPDQARVEHLHAGEEPLDLRPGARMARGRGPLPVDVLGVPGPLEHGPVRLARDVRDDQVAARRERVEQLRYRGVRQVVVRYEMQHADQ